MAKSTTLKHPRNPMPQYVRDALNKRGLMTAYRDRPPYQRNDYLGWISSAKTSDTKSKRLEQMLEELATGGRYMKMVWKPRAVKSAKVGL